VARAEGKMLTFDDHFEISRGDDELGNWCVLWADEPSFKRVSFLISPSILERVLDGGNAVHQDENIKVCERERPHIEAACFRAFANRPSNRIELELLDFL
jgi:hypothetical protein